jgi:hypothetical protein
VVNYSGGAAPGLTARVQLLNMDGAVKWEKSATLDSAEDSVAAPSRWSTRPASRPSISSAWNSDARGQKLVSENFYWRGVEEENYRACATLPKVKLDAATTCRAPRRPLVPDHRRCQPVQTAGADGASESRAREDRRPHPARDLQRQLCCPDARRKRTITTELRDADTRGEKPRIVVEGFNAGTAGRRPKSPVTRRAPLLSRS